MNTKTIGEISEMMVVARLAQKGFIISRPVGDNQRYDAIIDDGENLLKVQIKTGRIMKNGSVIFNTCSSYVHRGGKKKSYRGQIDFFGVYCPDNDKVYLIPINDVAKRKGVLRIDEPKNNQVKNVRWAKTYEIIPV